MARPSGENKVVLGLMTKFWQAGKVKTRLGKDIGMATAAKLHRLFLHRLCHNLGQSCDRRVLVVAPDNQCGQFENELDTWNQALSWEVEQQGDGDLGGRMQRWLRKMIADETFTGAVLIGADCPLLLPDEIDAAAEALHSHDVVLGPAADGGYYLIGLSAPWKEQYNEIFKNIPWGTEAVFELTHQRIVDHKLSVVTLERRHDIDTLEDLRLLQDSLAKSGCDDDFLRQINRTLDTEGDSR